MESESFIWDISSERCVCKLKSQKGRPCPLLNVSHLLIHPSFFVVLELDPIDISPLPTFLKRGSLKDTVKPDKPEAPSFLCLVCCFSTWQLIQQHLWSLVTLPSAVHMDKMWPTTRMFLCQQAGRSWRTTLVTPSRKIFHHCMDFMKSSKCLCHW